MTLRYAVLVAVLLAVVVAWPRSSAAHGTFDQGLEGDPGCNSSNFGASVTASSGQRQSFVPTGSQLISVALCVSAAAPDTPLVVAIYTAGGVLVGGGSTAQNPSIPDAAGPPVRYVHVDFLQPYTVTPGATYVIENVSGVPITWYGTTAASPYTYCQGEPNTSSVVDFGFQSFLVDSPGSPAPCLAAPTNTPVPQQPTNTPAPPTNTPAPGETVAPTDTPAPGTTAAASSTPATGNAGTGGGSGGTSGGSSGGAGGSGGAAGAGSGPSGLPGSGTGGSTGGGGGVPTPLLIAFAGFVAILFGAILERRTRRLR